MIIGLQIAMRESVRETLRVRSHALDKNSRGGIDLIALEFVLSSISP